MMKSNRSNILEIHGGDAVEVLKALALEARMEIVQMLATGSKNINELGTALGLSQPTITKHIQQLEQAGLVESEYMPGVQGMQKRCRLRYDRLIVSFDNPIEAEDRIEEINMPIGLYTLANPSGTCGLANREKIIGFLDKPLSFFDPERASAQILWMSDGFVEYTFPNDLPTSMEVTRFELMMEICSEAPNHNDDWPSDITVWINGVELGTWTSPADLGGKRGLRNPEWWIDHMTQHGFHKIWTVDSTGSSVDGTLVSEVDLDRIMVVPQSPITVRIGIRPDAEHRGGFNLFGAGFGNYAQDLVLRMHYVGKHGNSPSRRTDLASRNAEGSP